MAKIAYLLSTYNLWLVEMEIQNTDTNLHFQLAQNKLQMQSIEQQMQRCHSPFGTVNFNFHKLKREKHKIQEYIEKLNHIINPNIIA